nr:MAG TPA: Preprotein translocase subunit [Caudoviricetes sp.]
MPIYLIIAIAGSLVGIEILPFFLSLIIRLFRRERKEELPDLENLKEGEEVVWVGGYPYIVGGRR